MATLKTLNKTITTTSQELTSTRNRDALLSSSRRSRNDINRLANFTNSVVIEAFKSLSSGESYNFDAVDKGIAGNTVVTHLISCGNNSNSHEAYWFNDGIAGRPKTVKETFDYIISRLNATSITNNVIQDNSRVNDAFELINCNFNYIRKISGELLGKSYEDLLSCNNSEKSYPFTLGTHLYNILSQLTVGVDPALIAPYEQEESNTYPELSIPFERVSGRIERLFDLVDTTIIEVADGDVLQWSEDEAAWLNKPLAVSEGPEIISDLTDVSTVAPEEGQVLRSRSGLWVAENLPAYEDTQISLITKLEDVDTSTRTPGNSDLLVWDENHIDDTKSTQGAWVPRSINELDIGGGDSVVKGSFEGVLNGEFEYLTSYVDGTYELGTGGSPLMFMFKNTYKQNVILGDFSFTCSRMYANTMRFSFVKFNHAQLIANECEKISINFTLTKQNENTITEEGIGCFESNLNVELLKGEYVGVLLHEIEKTSNELNEMFFVTIEVN